VIRASSVHIAVSALCLLCQDVAAKEQSSFYRVEQSDGVWWFVGPDGERCFSSGVNVISPGATRERYDPAHPAYAAFHHYPNSGAWAEDALAQLQGWGFNTVGAWSSAEVKKGPLPYVEVLHVGKKLAVPWNDLLDPHFAEKVERLVAAEVEPRADDPHLLGWCTDNELGWYPDTMFMFHLKQSPERLTRRALIELLKQHYENDFSRLEADFRPVDVQSFAELEAGGELRLRSGGAGMRVVDRFASMLAKHYYQTMHDAIRRHDSHHLILGDRYPGYCADVVAQAAGPYVDVVSTNFDHPAWTDGHLPLYYLDRLNRLSGKPVLVTEYYVAAKQNQSGNKNSGNIFTTVDTQTERTAAVRNRLSTLASLPYVVGAHWFQYTDEPANGRDADGEDYNFGLIDIHNQPYEQLTATFARTHAQVPTLHAAGSPQADLAQPAVVRIPHASSDASTGLGGWDTQQARIASSGEGIPFADLLATWQDDRLYLAISCCRFVDKDFYAAEDVPQKSEQLEWDIALGDNAPTSRIFFGMGDETPNSEPALNCRVWSSGIRYLAIAQIPIERLGHTPLKIGEQLNLHAALVDRRAGTKTTWSNLLECGGATSAAQNISSASDRR